MPGPAARMGDQTVHGGVITGPGVPNVLIGGQPASVVGDMHVCPMVTPGTPPVPHVGGPVTSPGAPTVLIGGRPAATIGSICTCVGPPDSVVMGAPTVILGTAGTGMGSAGSAGGGGAAGANASAAAASFDNKESVTKEEHWVEFEFVDKAGNPVSGVPYKLKDTSGKESEGVLRLDGRIRRDALEKEGKCEVVLMSVSEAKWSTETVAVGETVEMSAKVEGFESGTKALLQILKRDIKGPDVVEGEVEAKVQGDKVKAEWTYTGPDETEVVVPDEGAEAGSADLPPYSAPSFYFEVIVGQCTARSGLLHYQDYVEIKAVDEEGRPIKNEDYVLYLSSGEVRKGKLDGSGTARVDDVPPGLMQLRLPGLPDMDPKG